MPVNAGSLYTLFFVTKIVPTPVVVPPGPAEHPSSENPIEFAALAGVPPEMLRRTPGTGLSVITNSGHAP